MEEITLTNIPLYNMDETYFFPLSDDDISGVIPYDKPIQKSRMKENMDVANETAANWDTETYPIIRLSKTPTVI